MTKTAALAQFFGQFGIPAFSNDEIYNEENDKQDLVFPWLTYEVGIPEFGEETIIMVHTHHYTESKAIPNELAERISNAVKEEPQLPCDGGFLWLKPATPSWQIVPDEGDAKHKHRIINVTIENLAL